MARIRVVEVSHEDLARVPIRRIGEISVADSLYESIKAGFEGDKPIFVGRRLRT